MCRPLGVNRHLRQSGQCVLRGTDGKLGRLDTKYRHAIGRVGAPFALRRLTAYGMAEYAVEKHQQGFTRRFDFADIRLNNHALRIIRHIHVQYLRTNFDHAFAALPECRLDDCFRPALSVQNVGQFGFFCGGTNTLGITCTPRSAKSHK